jgi:hypothetical protein
MWDGRLRTIMQSMSTTITNIMRWLAGPVPALPPHTASVTLRLAVPADADALDRLAQLDSRRAPRGAVIVAEVAGELWGAISIDDGHAIADPFRPTGELMALLHERSRQLRRAQRLQQVPRVWPQTGYDRAALS